MDVIFALTFGLYAVTLNGETVLPRARAAIVGGHALLPLRAIGEAVGADVGYDAQAKLVTVQRGERVSHLSVRGSVFNGRAYVPLRVVANIFGLGVDYQPQTRTIALANVTPSKRVSVAAPPSSPANATPRAGYTLTLVPANGASVNDAYPSITARFAGVTAIDPRTVRVSVDGRDVSADAAVVGDEVLYTPRSSVTAGTHTVTVTGAAANGAPLSATWSFNDTFAFAAPPPPTPYPVNAIYIDRWITPGVNAFDVVVRGAPGITGYVGVDGVNGIFPLHVYSVDTYLAHVVVPAGVNEPFARVGARLTLPNGTVQTIILPQTIGLFTANAPVPTPQPTSHKRSTIPVLRSVNVPPLTTPTPSPVPSASPVPRAKRRPLNHASPSPSPTPH